MLIDQTTPKTLRKVRGAAAAAMIATPLALVAASFLESLIPPGSVPALVLADALEPVIAMPLVTISTWAAGYFTRSEVDEL